MTKTPEDYVLKNMNNNNNNNNNITKTDKFLHFSKGEKKQDLKEKVAFCRE